MQEVVGSIPTTSTNMGPLWLILRGPNSQVEGSIPEGPANQRCIAQLGSAPAWGAGGRKFESCYTDHFLPFVSKRDIYAYMLKFITQSSDPLLEYIRDDPVRPDISCEFRVSNNRFVSALVDEKPRAIVCVSLHRFVPQAVQELELTDPDPDTAIFYTIWSYAPGAGAELLRETVAGIRQLFPNVKNFVTLSPKTEIARRFHLKNGARVMRENNDTVNYEYLNL